MKKFIVPTKLMLALIALGLTLTACTEDESTMVETEQELDTNEVARSTEIDVATATLDDVMIEIFEADEQGLDLGKSTNSRSSSPPHSLPDCVTITVVLESGFRQITIDFGEDGCEVRGHILKGKVIMSYERNQEAQQVFISYSLEGFYFDDKNIIGSKTLLKERSNENGNPQFTHSLDLTVIWDDGIEASRLGTKVKEWVEGHGSGVWSDNVFEITGNWTANFRNGNSHSYEVVIPLRREAVCRFFVSGSKNVIRTNFSGVLDFGEGDCDNMATFTFEDGTIRNIVLR